MKKLRTIGLFPIIVSLAAIAFAQGSTEYNKVDGFTSASFKLRVDSILVYRTYAEVYWWEFYELDADIIKYCIEWGKDSTKFTETVELRPYIFKTITKTRIEPLTDSTAYFAQFHRDWHGTVKKTPFKFNTPPLPNSIRQVRSPRFASPSKNVTGIDLYTVSGKRVFHADISKGVDATTIKPQVAAPGLYIMNYTDAANGIVKSEKSFFGR